MLRSEFLQRVNHVDFGRHQEHVWGGQRGDVLPHLLGPANEVGVLEHRPRALGVSHHNAPRVVPLGPQQILHAEDLVHHARSGPEDHRPTGHLREVPPQVLVGDEQDLFVGGHAFDDLAGVATGHNPVAQALHRRGGVDVGDGLKVAPFRPQLGLERRQLVGGATVGERAARLQVGQQHPLLRAQDLGRLGHEVHPGEDNGLLRDRHGVPGQLETVARVVGDLLDLAIHVEVRQDHRVVLPLECLDLFDQVERIFIAGSRVSQFQRMQHGRGGSGGSCGGQESQRPAPGPTPREQAGSDGQRSQPKAGGGHGPPSKLRV